VIHFVSFIRPARDATRAPERGALTRPLAMPCTCASPDALDWIRVTFRECITNDKQLAGFYLALLTVACWMCAQIPQFITNFRAKSARGLSPWFLTQWLAGDSFNLIGCLAAGDQKPTQTYTAVYFVVSDLVLIFQFLYYELPARLTRDASAGLDPSSMGSLTEPLTDTFNERMSDSEGEERAESPWRARERVGVLSPVGGFVISSALASSSLAEPMLGFTNFSVDDCEYNGNPAWMQKFGRVMGYVATAFYLGGRISQIAKNHRRGSVEGLSMHMFLLAIAANLAYGTSVLCASDSNEKLVRALPWLFGSLGTVALDVSILAQSRWMKNRRESLRSFSDANEAL